jgi:DNA-binding beta-propeller fold protein YncE
VILHGPRAQGARETIDLPSGTGPHITTFSPDGKYAYVSGMGNGDLDVIEAATRQIVRWRQAEVVAISTGGDFVFVSLRAWGKLAVVDFRHQAVSYVDLAPAATSINPANCMGCAAHGVAVRG